VSRSYTVFNIDQCDGITPPRRATCYACQPVERAEQLVASIRPAPLIRHAGVQAFFSPRQDMIQLPPPSSFTSPASYYSTLFHELVHWSGHKDRLARQTLSDMTMFGDSNYSREELVAEMGAGFLCALTGVDNQALAQNRAAYIGNWLARLRDDRRLVVSAAGMAQRAVDFLAPRTPLSRFSQESWPNMPMNPEVMP
jgi:antirestriction protein ArdC